MVWLEIQQQIVVLLDLAPVLGVFARHLAWVHFAQHLLEHKSLSVEDGLDGNLEQLCLDVVDIDLTVNLAARDLPVSNGQWGRWRASTLCLAVLGERSPRRDIGKAIRVRICMVHIVVTRASCVVWAEEEGNHERLDEKPLRNVTKLYVELVLTRGACPGLAPCALSLRIDAPASARPFLIWARDLDERVDHVLAEVLEGLEVVEGCAAHERVSVTRARVAIAGACRARVDGLQMREFVEEGLQEQHGEGFRRDLQLHCFLIRRLWLGSEGQLDAILE